MASFRKAWPDVMKELDDESHGGRGRGLQLLEEYDPEDETSENAVSKPWAFVCDCVKVLPAGKVSEVSMGGAEGGKGKGVAGAAGKEVESADKAPALSMNVTELIAQGPGSTPKAWEALADLRDKIAAGEKIDWWVIYNGDPERACDDDDSGYDEEEDEGVVEGQAEEIHEDQQPNRKTFVPREEDVSSGSAPIPLRQAPTEAQVPKASSKLRGMIPPPIPPPRPPKDKGRRTPGMRAFPAPGKSTSPPPAPAPIPVVKPETGLKKKLFGKKSFTS